MKFKYSSTLFTNESATELLKVLFEIKFPNSLIDIGCGIGNWSATAIELGINEVTGIDFSEIVGNELQIPSGKFIKIDLRKPFDLKRKYDLAISLEVGEHLPGESANSFVSSICRHSDFVLFSSAIPGQEGYWHINEQWPEYWAALFRSNGFCAYDILRDKIWDNPKIKPWYKQNVILYAKKGMLDSRLYKESLQVRKLVHPDIFLEKALKINDLQNNPDIAFSFRILLRAIAMKIGYKRIPDYYRIKK